MSHPEGANLDRDGILTEEQAAVVLCKSVGTLRQWAHKRKGPPRIKVGQSVMYDRADLLTWIRSHRVDFESVRPRQPGGTRGRVAAAA